jgi:hypothetical protein
MRRQVRGDLRLGRLRIAWFGASERSLSEEEWTDSIICLLNTRRGSEGDLRGLASPDAGVVWCRSDLTPHMAAETVALEARHLWQFTQRVWAPPIAGDDPVAFCSAWDEWYQRSQIDAAIYYGRKLAPIAQTIAREWATSSPLSARLSTVAHAPLARGVPRVGWNRRLSSW